jgi:hypothetical protein
MLDAGSKIVAEVKGFGVWTGLSIDDALLLKKRILRCPDCHGRVRPHAEGKDGQSAHMEHYERHQGCPRGDCFEEAKRGPHHRPLT